MQLPDPSGPFRVPKNKMQNAVLWVCQLVINFGTIYGFGINKSLPLFFAENGRQPSVSWLRFWSLPAARGGPHHHHHHGGF